MKYGQWYRAINGGLIMRKNLNKIRLAAVMEQSEISISSNLLAMTLKSSALSLYVWGPVAIEKASGAA